MPKIETSPKNIHAYPRPFAPHSHLRASSASSWLRGSILLVVILAMASFALAETVYETRSKYQRITVIDTPNGMRQMIFDAKLDGSDAIQSEMDKQHPLDLTLSYARGMIASLPLVKDNPPRILVVGLGG